MTRQTRLPWGAGLAARAAAPPAEDALAAQAEDALVAHAVDALADDLVAARDADRVAGEAAAGRDADRAAEDAVDEEEPFPSFSEQVAQQLGGVRGLVEASIPVTAFVVLNFAGTQTRWWSLRTSLITSVLAAVAIAGYRLSRREPIRHAVNGVFGVALGALLAWRSGDARDFYLPGILLTAGNAVALLVSVTFRRPLVGWIWSITLDGGGTRWYRHDRLLRTFGWLTVLWATVYVLKVCLQFGLYLAHQVDLLGVTRLALGWPPYALLLVLTIWSVRRVTRDTEDSAGADSG